MIDVKVGQDFLRELVALYRKYNVSISHEDSQGAFLLEKLTSSNIDWILGADYGVYQRDNDRVSHQ